MPGSETDKAAFREHTASDGDGWLTDFLSLAQTRGGFQGLGQRKKGFGEPRTDLRVSQSLDDIKPD